MQYLLTEEEYKRLTSIQCKTNIMTDNDIKAYLRRLPHFGPVTIYVLLKYLKDDGLQIVSLNESDKQ